MRKLNSRGFTLLELLLSVAIISLLAGLSLPVYRILISKNDLDIAAATIVQSLRRAQVLSQAVSEDEDGVDILWGVKVLNDSIVIFKGTSYATRDSDFDEEFDMPATVDVGATNEVVFTKFTGFPTATGTINLTTEGDSRSIAVNEKGTITY